MEKVKEFDKMLKEAENYSFLMSRVVAGLTTILGCFIMLLPFEPGKMESVYVTPFLMAGMGMTFYLQPYLFIKDKKRIISIYQQL